MQIRRKIFENVNQRVSFRASANLTIVHLKTKYFVISSSTGHLKVTQGPYSKTIQTKSAYLLSGLTTTLLD